MSSTLSESLIVMNLAEQVCQRITRKVIRDLQVLDNGLQVGDDSGLTNAWEEICVQVQYWEDYDLTVSQTISLEVAELLPHEREAVWLQTPEGEDWDSNGEESRAEYPVAVDDIVEYLKKEYVYTAAANWSNKRIRKYVDR
jgi:hypothetical protein